MVVTSQGLLAPFRVDFSTPMTCTCTQLCKLQKVEVGTTRFFLFTARFFFFDNFLQEGSWFHLSTERTPLAWIIQIGTRCRCFNLRTFSDWFTIWKPPSWINDKKLSYRRGTARCVVSVEILPIATQQCENYLYDKSWTNRSYEVKGGLRWANV